MYNFFFATEIIFLKYQLACNFDSFWFCDEYVIGEAVEIGQWKKVIFTCFHCVTSKIFFLLSSGYVELGDATSTWSYCQANMWYQERTRKNRNSANATYSRYKFFTLGHNFFSMVGP